jgi:methyl-accepting chemotaxis protein
MLSNMKIGRKLLIGFSLVLLMGLLQGVISVFQIDVVNREAQIIAVTSVPAIELVGQIHYTTSDIRVALLRHVMEGDAEKKKKIEEDLKKLDTTLESSLNAYSNQALSDEEKHSLESFRAEWKKVGFVRGQAMEYSRSNDSDAAEAQLTKGGKAFLALSESLKNLEQVNQGTVNVTAQSIQSTYRKAITSTFVTVLFMIVLGAAIAWSLSRSIAQGIGDAAQIVMNVADGNLNNHIPLGGGDELGQMLRSLQTMQSNLSKIVSAVRCGAEMVAHASIEIAQGNLDLSNRTEYQASALQETTASMSDLGGNVRQTAESAQEANELALQASSIANKGGAEVLRVVSTMKEIDASSRKISDIISVIDGIAFQTNILALNAAVEAARAGDHGLGFAVVAGEVRTLAGRSAEAAKEIKSLIGDSVERVRKGTSLVSQTGTTMTEVVDSIQNVTDIMGRINVASRNQATGVSQVGAAVAQLDQVTQQNAALVEQMSAATKALQHQASELVQAVAVFKLGVSDDQITRTVAQGLITSGVAPKVKVARA